MEKIHRRGIWHYCHFCVLVSWCCEHLILVSRKGQKVKDNEFMLFAFFATANVWLLFKTIAVAEISYSPCQARVSAWHYPSIMDEKPKLDLFTLSCPDPIVDTHQIPLAELWLTCQLTLNTLTSFQRANVMWLTNSELLRHVFCFVFSSDNIATMTPHLGSLIS